MGVVLVSKSVRDDDEEATVLYLLALCRKRRNFFDFYFVDDFTDTEFKLLH